MAKSINEDLVQLCTKFYLNNKDQYSTRNALIDAFKEKYPNTPNKTNLQKLYFPIDGYSGIKKTRTQIPNKLENGINIEEDSRNKFINYKGEKSITSLEEAIKFFEVDLKVWDVVDWKCKSWDTSMNIKVIEGDKPVSKPVKRTNYAVSLNLKKRVEEINYTKIFKNIKELYNKYPKLVKTNGSGIGVITIADIHIGLKVTQKGGIINTPEFNVDTVIRYLAEIAERSNRLNYKEVHLVILGDLVESVSGYNHIETLKEMESTITGGNIIILAYEILQNFITKIKNLKKVYMISGNHDRLTPDKAMDKDGGACQLVAYMLKNIVDVQWHPLLISTNIDEIRYILTHGHLKISQQDLGKLFFEYGDQNSYNVMLSGHWHIRKLTKIFQEKNLILADTTKYRCIVVAPITSGTRWTEENGWSCAPGFTITEANSSKKNINFYDLALS